MEEDFHSLQVIRPTLLHQQESCTHSLKKDHPFWAYSGYAMASFVGASRVLRDKHWVSDVLFGAGLGILSSHLSYHLDIWDSRGDASLQKSSILSHISLGITPLGAGLTVEF